MLINLLAALALIPSYTSSEALCRLSSGPIVSCAAQLRTDKDLTAAHIIYPAGDKVSIGGRTQDESTFSADLVIINGNTYRTGGVCLVLPEDQAVACAYGVTGEPEHTLVVAWP